MHPSLTLSHSELRYVLSSDDSRLFQVTIPNSPPVSAVLGGSLILPCFVSSGRHAMFSLARVKWSKLSSDRETEILVAQGERMKVSELYKGRASLPGYASSSAELTLQLDGLRHNDTGFYRCEVQNGLEDAHALAQIKVKGVVFHYRHASSRYAFSFDEAKDACEDIGAQIATPEQLLAAYHSGYEQCDAGWLADGSVRYPIHMPREGCFGDMDGLPGIRNYGMMDQNELFDVYCYIENIHGEVFHGSSPERFTLPEAKTYCEQQGAELATTSQLYAAWNDGLNHCNPGWLADGSVRYPIVTPRERCGGSEAGVKTVYRFSNQTGFPDPHIRHDAYCFRGNWHLLGIFNVNSYDRQGIVTLAEPEELFSLGYMTQHTVNEAQGAVETLPLSSEQTPVEPNEHDPTPSPHSDIYATIINEKVLTTSATYGWEPESTQDSWKEVLTSHIGFEFVPKIHLEPSPKQSEQVENPDAEIGTTHYEKKIHNHKHYQPMPDTNLEAGERVEYETYTEGKPATKTDSLGPPSEVREVGGSKHFQPMPETNLDDEDGSHPPISPGYVLRSSALALYIHILNQWNLSWQNWSVHQWELCVLDSCVENPCANGGTCVDIRTGVKCLCLPTYGGEFCQNDLEQCEPGWEKFQGNCYKHFSKRQSWEAAEQHCRMCAAHLVSVMSPEEQHFLNDKYREYQWTGLNDRTIEGDFRWSDGNPLLYENWCRGQPDSYFLSGEDCVVMVWHDQGRWSDVPCNYHLPYTCKKGIVFCGQPPVVLNALLFGRQRQRYESSAQVRYHCQDGFIQRHNPIVRCQSNGQWEEPQITCTPKHSGEDLIPISVSSFSLLFFYLSFKRLPPSMLTAAF
uniref:Brevican n=1 Tax=Electrophorus electricus TaxID=8005 RepID=A0A4W4FZL4_ELEEL